MNNEEKETLACLMNKIIKAFEHVGEMSKHVSTMQDIYEGKAIGLPSKGPEGWKEKWPTADEISSILDRIEQAEIKLLSLERRKRDMGLSK